MQYLHAPSDIALISAVQRAEIDVVKRLLIEDKDCINCADEKGYTAYHWAAYIDDVTILDAIYDADHDAMWRSKTLKDQTVLHIACSNASMTCIKRIVELVGGSKEPSPAGYIDRRNKHLETALHLAAGTNRVDIVQILLEVGRADPYLLDQWNRTPRKVLLYCFTMSALCIASVILSVLYAF